MQALLDRQKHNEQQTNHNSQSNPSIAARTKAAAMASWLEFHSNIPHEHRSIKTARGTFESIIFRASFMEVWLLRLALFAAFTFPFFRQILWHN
jgi:hypothetical protein